MKKSSGCASLTRQNIFAACKMTMFGTGQTQRYKNNYQTVFDAPYSNLNRPQDYPPTYAQHTYSTDFRPVKYPRRDLISGY